MSRDEHDRENLLEDATAYVRRIEFRGEDNAEIFVGFRPGGGASLYIEQDPVYHFTSEGELRRAYVDGALIKAVSGKLVAMRRERAAGEVQLVSQTLDAAATQEFLGALEAALTLLAASLRNQKLAVVGSIPPDADVASEVLAWLESLLAREITIAKAPNAR